MQADQNLITNPTTINPKARIRNLKKSRRKFKATIRQLREDLANSRELADELSNKWLDERQKVKELLAEKSQRTTDTMNAVLEAENKVHDARKAAYAVHEPLFDAFLTLSKLMTRLSQENA